MLIEQDDGQTFVDSKLRLTQAQITRQIKEEDVNQAALIEQLHQSTSLLWLVLVVVWVVSALRTKRTVQSQSSASQLLYTALLVVGVYMIFAKQSGIPWLDRHLFPVTVPIALAGLLVVLVLPSVSGPGSCSAAIGATVSQ